MKSREKEINYLIYLKSKLIQDTKKEIKQLRLEKESPKRSEDFGVEKEEE